MQTTVSVRGQTVIPKKIREKFMIHKATKLQWIANGTQIVVKPIPDDPIKAFRGKWKGKALNKILLKTRREDRELEEILDEKNW